MHARVSYYELGTASKDDATSALESARDTVESMQGNKGGMMLVDTEHSKAITITLWETEQALRDTEQAANAVREQAAGGAGMSISGVESYEVTLEFGR